MAGNGIDWSTIGWASFGGAVAGAVSAIPIFNGFGVGSYLGSAMLGGTGSVLGGVVSGSVTDIQSVLIAFGVGAFAGAAAKGVHHLRVNNMTNKVMNIASSKSRSVAINNYMISNGVKPMGMGHNSFGGWSVNLFKSMTKDFFRSIVIDTTQRSALLYSAIVLNGLSGWY